MNHDMDAQRRYLVVMLTSGPALQIIRQQRRVEAHSLAQLQELTHFDFGQEPTVSQID